MDAMGDEVEPLRKLLGSIVSRLEAIESKVGIESPPSSSSGAASEPQVSPGVQAYKLHLSQTVLPLCQACDALEPLQKAKFGACIRTAWETIGAIVVLASEHQKPKGGAEQMREALAPYLKGTQESITTISKARLPRQYDYHQKALLELLPSLSWIFITPPPQSPTSFVKDLIGATEFWTNKIRKLHKTGTSDQDKAQVAFCEAVKAVLVDLVGYTKEFHLSGLWFNPRGKEFGEAPPPGSLVFGGTAPPGGPCAKTQPAPAGGGGNAVLAELTSRQNADGSSAAKGLRKVTKEEQTWRAEYKKPSSSTTTPTTTTTAPKKSSPSKSTPPLVAKPICEFDAIRKKWRVEHQTKENCTSGKGGHLKIEVKDAKEQAYIYKCQNLTIELTGKLKTIILDDCLKVNVVFHTAISSCEVVNCKRVQLQTLGVCPSFTVDKTDGCLMYLSEETMGVTSIVASKSSEMNVCYPDKNGEIKETPIPEQFVHKLVNGAVTSEVSDLYH